MIDEPHTNLITRPYRGLSVQEIDDVDLTEEAVTDWLIGREVYRRTNFLLLNSRAQYALVAVEKASTTPLFSPVVGVRWLAGPDQVLMIDSPTTDVGNASALAALAAEHVRPDVLAYAVRGRFQHINFIWRPRPVVVSVTEVVPPWPAKLLAMAQHAVAFDEDLPPIELQLKEVDLTEVAQAHPADHYLLPCRGSGVDVPAQMSFLDTRPPSRRDWLMLGCERSMQFHRHFYGDEPDRIDICPRRRPRTDSDALTLAKCCLLERGVEVAGATAIVPWGANLDEVRAALRHLVGLGVPEPPHVTELAVAAGQATGQAAGR